MDLMDELIEDLNMKNVDRILYRVSDNRIHYIDSPKSATIFDEMDSLGELYYEGKTVGVIDFSDFKSYSITRGNDVIVRMEGSLHVYGSGVIPMLQRYFEGI